MWHFQAKLVGAKRLSKIKENMATGIRISKNKMEKVKEVCMFPLLHKAVG